MSPRCVKWGLEKMEKVDTLVVDKTGSLTEDRPKFVHMSASQICGGQRWAD